MPPADLAEDMGDQAFAPLDAQDADSADMDDGAPWPDDWADSAAADTAAASAPAAAPAPTRSPLQPLPVVNPRPHAHVDEADSVPNQPLAQVQPAVAAAESVAVRVREGSEDQAPQRAMPPPEPPPVTGDALGDFWHTLVQDLVAREAVTALVRELALQSQLVERQPDQWTLRVENETLGQSGARDRLQNALRDAGHAVRLEVLIGRVGDSPSRRNAIAAAQRLKAAEALVLADPFVQEMMRDFGAKIVPGSIKPL
jgi:DNA polymerase-3 subunit gamma/tau